MDCEELLEGIGKVLADRDPEMYERARNTHRLLPFICMQGHAGGSLILEAIPPHILERKKSRTILDGDIALPYDHDYTDEKKLVQKSQSGIALYVKCEALHMALCVGDDEFTFMEQVLGFYETPLGMLMAICAMEARKRGGETWARFCYSLNLRGFLDVMTKQLDRVPKSDKSSFEMLCDPLLKIGRPIWKYYSLKTFSEGKPPTHTEMDEFCHRWVREQRKDKRRVKEKKNTPYQDILEDGWIVEGFWCLDWQDIPYIREDVDDRTPKTKIGKAETIEAHIDGFKKAANRAALKSEYKHSEAMLDFTKQYRDY